MFSRRCATDDVPGISRIFGDRYSSHASATAAAPAYLDAHGRPAHPRELLSHACLRGQFAGGAMPTWDFERDGEVVRVDPSGPLVVRPAAAVELAVDAALAGLGVVHLYEGMLRAHLDSGALEPILEPWWQRFSGPFLYYPGRRHLPSPLRAFVDFLKATEASFPELPHLINSPSVAD
jgi:DNA-binding transcriptional LysR family regulator